MPERRRPVVGWEDDEPASKGGRPYDHLVKPWDLDPPIYLGSEMTWAISNDEVLHIYEQAHAISWGDAEMPKRNLKTEMPVPAFGASEQDKKDMAKAIKKIRKETRRTWTTK